MNFQLIHLHRKLACPDKHYSAVVVKAKDHVDRVLANLGALEDSLHSIRALKSGDSAAHKSLTIHGEFDADRYRRDCIRNYRINVVIAFMDLDRQLQMFGSPLSILSMSTMLGNAES